MKRLARLLMLCGLTALSAPGFAATDGQGTDAILITARPKTSFPLPTADFDLSAIDHKQTSALRLAQSHTPSTLPGAEGSYQSFGGDSDLDDNRRYRSFGSQAWAVKWEYAAVFAEITAIHIKAALREGGSFDFENEGWLGRDTSNLGVDKFTHSYNTYLATELLQWRLSQKTNNAPGTALTAAVMAVSLVAYSEFYDAIEPNSGWSWQDMTFNVGGAALSMLRHTIPGLKNKLDYRMMIVPNHDVITFTGKEHFRQQRFLLALQLSGFKGLEESPLRFVELHAGYYATGFTDREKAAGRRLDRRPFIGIGLNLQQLLFPNPKSLPARIAHRWLDYVQVPYTAAHIH